nr:NADH dehydrogenase subunit 2 [Fenusa (Kaliofenusa) sp. 1 GYN-2022b]
MSMAKYFNLTTNKMNIKFSYTKYLFLMMLMLGTMITINSSSWFNAWMGMEINLMTFIPLMINKSMKNKISNSMMIYFITQATASSMLMVMIIMLKINVELGKSIIIMIMLQFSLMIKLGGAPMHWWLPKVTLNLSWMNCLIILTWQKIAPIFLINTINNNSMNYLMSILSVYMGSMLGLNQTSIKMIMTYSSVNHLGWMLMTLIMNFKMMILYFLIYSLITTVNCMAMNNLNINYINQLFKINSQDFYSKIMVMMSLISLAGLPPLLGFLPKMITLIMMMKNNLFMESILFITMATISMSYYMTPITSMMLMTSVNNKWNNKNPKIFKGIVCTLMINVMFIFIIATPLMNNFM